MLNAPKQRFIQAYLYINHKRITHPSLLYALSNYNIATVEGGEIPVSYLQIPSPWVMQPITAQGMPVYNEQRAPDGE